MMMRFAPLTVAAALVTALALTSPAWALIELIGLKNDANAAKTIQEAKSGTNFLLEEGTYKMGNVNVPAGVQVHGRGYNKTFIDAAGFENGFILSDKPTAGSVVCDLAIRNATGAGVVIDGSSAVVARVAILGCPAGVTVAKAGKCRLENLIVADAQSGVSLVDCTNSSLVNATLADIAGTAINVSGCEKVTIFNNLVAGAAFGIVLGEGNKELAIDHNIYNANNIGRMPGHIARRKMEAWYHLSGYDRHSQTIVVDFKDAANHDYRVVSPLRWSPTRATTAYTGAAEFNGVKAPVNDMNISVNDTIAKVRGPSVDIGAHQTSFDAPRKADGTFEVKSGEGVTSAGLFTRDGVCVQYLFQNTPLPKGMYEYWLPSRDWQGREIKAGEYELRLVESNLKLRYVAAAGNGDAQTSKQMPATTAKRYSLDPFAAAFTADGRILFTQSGFESGEHVRLFSPDMGEVLWSMKGGGHAVGVAIDHDKKLAYVLRQGGQPGAFPPCSLIRINVEDGTPAPFANGSFEKSFDGIKGAGGMTLLGDKMYITETAANKVHILAVTAGDVTVTGSFEAASPTQIAAYDERNEVGVISEHKIICWFDANGKLKSTLKLGEESQPTAIAYNNRLMAFFDAKDNKVLVIHPTDEKFPAGIQRIGVGGEGYGKIQGDKFWGVKSLALDKDGRLLVIDDSRTILFDKDGKVVRHMMGMWGQGIGWGMFAGDDRAHFFNIGGTYDIILDAKKQTWEPGTRWKYTMTSNTPNFTYAAGGKTFAVYPAREKDQPQYLYVTRMEPDTGTARVMSRYGFDDQGLFRQLAGAEGVVADDAAKEYQKDGEGQAITWNFFNERGFWQALFNADGHIVVPHRKLVQVIPMTGLDANGVPTYDFTKMQLKTAVTMDGETTFTSPYDFKTIDDVSIAEDMSYFADGSFTAVMTTKSGPGPDLCTEHANSTNMAGFDAQGNMRWFSATNPFGLKMGLYGIRTIGDITFAGRGAICEWETMDRDGLGTGTLGTPADMGWGGMWLDNHRQTQGFIGNDGKPYLIAGDYCAQTYHWLALEGHDKLLRQKLPVTVDAALAAALAKEAAQPAAVYPVPQPPRFTIKKIDKDLPADGDLAKWRTLGIKPIVIAPDQTAKNDPRDTSAVIRLAWNGKDKMFVQVIKFDDVLTFHQRQISSHYLHDGVEMCINVFYNGWKYNVTRMNGEDVVYRDRFFESRSGFLTAEQSPRKITLLDNAKDVEERKMLEAARGVDMSGCKVMVIEFTLTPEAIADMNGAKMEFGSGKSFLVGFMVNDGDIPGADLMNIITWPVMYGTFSREEGFATATFE